MTQLKSESPPFDVCCVGMASYDLIFSVPCHPGADEKCVASELVTCGGGPAANASIAVASLGGRAAYCGYLSRDHYGELHINELAAAGVNVSHVIRGDIPSPLSAIIVKPDGKRSIVSYKAAIHSRLSLEELPPARVYLFDGHELGLSESLLEEYSAKGVTTVLDAGSLHAGTRALAPKVDYLVSSHKFARELSKTTDPIAALEELVKINSNCVITLGEDGLVYSLSGTKGKMPAEKIKAVNTSGAGDAFHGAFSLAIARGKEALSALKLASSYAACICTQHASRSVAVPRELSDAFS